MTDLEQQVPTATVMRRKVEQNRVVLDEVQLKDIISKLTLCEITDDFEIKMNEILRDRVVEVLEMRGYKIERRMCGHNEYETVISFAK